MSKDPRESNVFSWGWVDVLGASLYQDPSFAFYATLTKEGAFLSDVTTALASLAAVLFIHVTIPGRVPMAKAQSNLC